MKKKYIEPTIEIIEFDINDIATSSGIWEEAGD